MNLGSFIDESCQAPTLTLTDQEIEQSVTVGSEDRPFQTPLGNINIPFPKLSVDTSTVSEKLKAYSRDIKEYADCNLQSFEKKSPDILENAIQNVDGQKIANKLSEATRDINVSEMIHSHKRRFLTNQKDTLRSLKGTMVSITGVLAKILLGILGILVFVALCVTTSLKGITFATLVAIVCVVSWFVFIKPAIRNTWTKVYCTQMKTIDPTICPPSTPAPTPTPPSAPES